MIEDRALLLVGDSSEVLARMAPDSVDAVVTDPPYGLSKEPDAHEVLTHWLAGDDFEHRGGGFMGKSWDSFVPGPRLWRGVYRVLKPGGYILCFAGSRTVDLMAMSLRLANFKIMDQLQWVYGSGFPKSMDIAKAIQKKLGVQPLEVRPHDFGFKGWNPINNKLIMPEPDGIAAEWKGWGTALKPAHEPIIVAWKPGNDSTTLPSNMTGTRFRYIPKPSKAEKNAGLEEFDARQTDTSRSPDQKAMDGGKGNPYNRGVKPVKNYHPTVKPVELMRYLIDLVTPAQGVVLDPFVGSGTTGIAALLEGAKFVGIDLDEGFIDLSRARIEHWAAV